MQVISIAAAGLSCSFAAHLAAKDVCFASFVALPVLINALLIESYCARGWSDLTYSAIFLTGFLVGVLETPSGLSLNELLLSVLLLCGYSVFTALDEVD